MIFCYDQAARHRWAPLQRTRRRRKELVALTVDQLARAAGTTTRQVRALQSQGLLPHPRLVGRTGYYDHDHLGRLRAILRLQAEGFSLAAIAALIRAWETGATLEQVLGLPSRRVAAGDDTDAFEGWPAQRRGRLLSVVPSTVLDDLAAS
jgi:DNA-binding transcriptional MerR regulator